MDKQQSSSVAKMPPPILTASSSKDPSNTSPRLFLSALGVILVITEVVMFGFFYKPTIDKTSMQTPSGKPTSLQIIPTPTNISSITPIPILSNCILWSLLTRNDVGNSRCIFGRIIKIYSAGQYREIIRFSEEAGSFLIWDRDKFIGLSVGQCIAAEGYIHQDASELYMEISGTTFFEYPGCP